jgi:hypothetical protein
MKKLFYLVSLAGVLLILNACGTTGYVTSEPMYQEYSRPDRPSNLHIWIDGDWIFNRQTHMYVRQNGHWQKSGRNRTYVSGSWQRDSQGLRWRKGHWQR